MDSEFQLLQNIFLFKGKEIQDLEDLNIFSYPNEVIHINNKNLISQIIKCYNNKEKSKKVIYLNSTVNPYKISAGSKIKAWWICKRDPEHVWYADFRNNKIHYVIYYNRVFKIDVSKKEDYQKAIDYGSKLGLPDYQLDFSPYHKAP